MSDSGKAAKDGGREDVLGVEPDWGAIAKLGWRRRVGGEKFIEMEGGEDGIKRRNGRTKGRGGDAEEGEKAAVRFLAGEERAWEEYEGDFGLSGSENVVRNARESMRGDGEKRGEERKVEGSG